MAMIRSKGGVVLNKYLVARVFAFDDHDRRRELDLYGLGSGIRKTEFSPDGSLLAVVGSNSNVALYDTATAKRRLIPRP